jgi:tetratricopeptide (TPR) repeat protein
MDAPGLAIRAIGALAVFLLLYFFNPARLVTSTSALDVATIVGVFEAQYRDRFASSETREMGYQVQIQALTSAITALAQQRSQPDAPPGIEEALAQLQQGHTQPAETIFETVLARKAAEGHAANQQAAEAARHLGTLAFLHDTEKALTAYRRVVTLDLANGDGWNSLELLLYCIGHLDEAVNAFNQVRALGTKSGDQTLLARAYRNLGGVYWVRGDRTQAEAMHRQALQLDEALGYKTVWPVTTSTWAACNSSGRTRRRPQTWPRPPGSSSFLVRARNLGRGRCTREVGCSAGLLTRPHTRLRLPHPCFRSPPPCRPSRGHR